jgi:threonine synthase
MDSELNDRLHLTSANSINVARFLPQSFYYYWAYAQLANHSSADQVVIAVPSGNLGNLTAGLFAKQTGLPVKRFIAANNRNDVFYQYLKTGKYRPAPSIQTVANAMDVGAPSNFARILDLYGSSHTSIQQAINGFTYNDEAIKAAVREVYRRTGYLLDPHGACGYMALKEGIRDGETGVFLATAHPAKFQETVEASIGTAIKVPDRLKAFMSHEKRSLPIPNDLHELKKVLIARS